MIKLIISISTATLLIVAGIIGLSWERFNKSREYHEDVILEFAATMHRPYVHKADRKRKIKGPSYSEEEIRQMKMHDSSMESAK